MARSFKLFRLVFLVALLAALLACPALSSAENAATPVTGITLSESELLVPLGTQSVLTAAVAPEKYLTVLDAGYAWTISVSVSEATGGTGVGSDETDWESWGAGTP